MNCLPKLACLSIYALAVGWSPCWASLEPLPPRVAINLDGIWQVEEGSVEVAPAQFTHSAVVPGLLDMAKPPFGEVGQKSARRQAFWYRRTFRVKGSVPEVALLKVHKACYGTKAWLNGRVVGEHLPCFTPAYFDLTHDLRGGGQENELLIRVGADRDLLPKGMPTGWDFEKYRFIPGIYDSVEVILSGAPFVMNIQTVPDLPAEAVRVFAEIQAGGRGFTGEIKAEVRETASSRLAGTTTAGLSLRPNEHQTIECVVPLQRCRLWSPETPFLYELRLSTGADRAKTRFGMRSFQFEAGGKYALLNGKRYFLRGSNVTIYRFFEDAQRGDRPWRTPWVRRLHQQFKSMHWNALRYCIGFPPERWYDVADEEGFLIQDEFPIWTLSEDPEKLEAARIIPEYREWMRERWNHPCVVIWDAQNESHTAVTAQALQAVRGLDRSNRPWENGWGEPQSQTDCVEAHPYQFYRDWASQGKEHFHMSDFGKMAGKPPLTGGQNKLPVPVIIDEYAWLWLTRDGAPTCLTEKVYDNLLGKGATPAERQRLYAKLLAAKTEFWRAHRECAGVLHFCGLGYSRPGDRPRPEGGATSDHWRDLERLTFEPNFARYVRDAFNPVGIMADFWDEQVVAGAAKRVPVYVINDLEPAWKGVVRLQVWLGATKVAEQARTCTVAGYGREILNFSVGMPTAPGDYTLIAELVGKPKPIHSVRDFTVVPKGPTGTR